VAQAGAARPWPGPDISAREHEGGDSSREPRRVPAVRLPNAEQELARELGVVAVLAEGKGGMRAGAGPAGAEQVVYVLAGDSWRLGLDYEPERVTQGQPKEGAFQRVR
jgi:hypothetical protein